MNLSVGIVGLPNVGKSTLFNALLKKQQALAANYPFATIEPNVGVVAVRDERLEVLAKITADEVLKQVQDDKSKWPPIKPATVEFIDIAGLVKGASEGAGLGNKFLSHIREVSVIAHVVRAFADQNVIKEGSTDPKNDYETINTELILADLATVQKTQSQLKRFQNSSDKNAIEKLFKALDSGMPARDVELSEDEQIFVRPLFLLSNKPELIVLNVSENDYNPKAIKEIIEKYLDLFCRPGKSETHPGSDSGQTRMTNNMVVISAKIESDLAALSDEEQKEYLANLGLLQSGLERLIQKAYETLGLISFLTAGEKEVRAWTIKKGSTAVRAAGEIHTDFMKKFIKAEVVSYGDFVSLGGWKKARELGKTRFEGKEYVMQDGDVVEFKIGS